MKAFIERSLERSFNVESEAPMRKHQHRGTCSRGKKKVHDISGSKIGTVEFTVHICVAEMQAKFRTFATFRRIQLVNHYNPWSGYKVSRH